MCRILVRHEDKSMFIYGFSLSMQQSKLIACAGYYQTSSGSIPVVYFRDTGGGGGVLQVLRCPSAALSILQPTNLQCASSCVLNEVATGPNHIFYLACNYHHAC